MTEILDLTPAMDLDTELTNGMDNNDDRHPMENEPPLPQDDSRPGTPHLTNCEQMKILARNIKWIKRRRLPYHERTPPKTRQLHRPQRTNAERPIKVVIKGLPKKAKPEDIEKDLIDLGFTVDRVSQLIGKITNQPLPVFLVSLPRNMTNANIFKLDKLSFLNVTVEGYDSKGVTQCYKCQQFNHTASNCHIKPKCLKCGEPHQTSECEIDKVETMYCVNCEAYGHMANYSKCPLYPKPRKGATIKTKLHYNS
ncbi:PRE_C2HC domain-containing protein [Trichonephila clavipes]|nr:PRE_C2HC domain-containing protein [Trichonephila clavipes]